MHSRIASPLRLAIFWLGIQAVWGALLGISLQSRVLEVDARDSLLAYGALATWGAVAAALTQIGVGPWSDARRRNGSRRVEFYTVGVLVGAAALAWFYGAGTLLALSVAYIAVQVGMNLAIGPYQAVVPDVVERARFGVASSWMAALQSVGNAVGAVVASLLADARAIAGTLDLLLLGSAIATGAHVRALRLQPVSNPEPLRITRSFIDLFISRALVYVGFYTLLGYLLFYVSATLGVAPLAQARRWAGILILTFTVLGALGAWAAARPSDRADKRLVATLGGGIVAIGLALFAAQPSQPVAIAATVLAGFGWGVFLVADWAMACRILPSGALATTMGIWNLAVIAPQIIAPALTTGVLARAGILASPSGPRVAFALAIGEICIGIAWIWRLSRSAAGE